MSSFVNILSLWPYMVFYDKLDGWIQGLGTWFHKSQGKRPILFAFCPAVVIYIAVERRVCACLVYFSYCPYSSSRIYSSCERQEPASLWVCCLDTWQTQQYKPVLHLEPLTCPLSIQRRIPGLINGSFLLSLGSLASQYVQGKVLCKALLSCAHAARQHLHPLSDITLTWENPESFFGWASRALHTLWHYNFAF